MRSPYASGREICVQKIRKCVPTKRIRDTNEAFQKHLFHRVRQTIRRKKVFANDALSFRGRLPRVVRCALRPSPAFCVRSCTHRFHCFAYSYTSVLSGIYVHARDPSLCVSTDIPSGKVGHFGTLESVQTPGAGSHVTGWISFHDQPRMWIIFWIPRHWLNII